MTHRVAIVTGASRGLGRALAVGLAERGWRLVIDGRDPDALAEASRAMPGAVALAGDVSDPSHRAALLSAANDQGGLDLLVNNAGILGPSPLPPLRDYPLDRLRDVYEINVVAPLALAIAGQPLLEASYAEAMATGYLWHEFGDSHLILP